MQGRPVRESLTELSEFALPNNANPLGNLLGGRIMHLVDLAAATAAMRHARGPVVTASVDSMSFFEPIHIGQLVTLKASVNRVFRSSMEVGVRVTVEDLTTGVVRHTNSCYLTFVALREDNRPRPIAPVIPETPEELRRFEQAARRREIRLELRASQRPRD